MFKVIFEYVKLTMSHLINQYMDFFLNIKMLVISNTFLKI